MICVNISMKKNSSYRVLHGKSFEVALNFKKRKVYSSFQNNMWGKRVYSYCVSLIFVVNMLGLLRWETKNILQQQCVNV